MRSPVRSLALTLFASAVSFTLFGATANVSSVSELTTALADDSVDDIILADGTYELTAQITIGKAVTVRGTTREGTIVTLKSGTKTTRLFQLNDADAVLKDMTVQNGNAKTGSNILLTLGTVENCIVQNGRSDDNGQGGAAIAVYDGANKVASAGTIRNCIIRNNLATPRQNAHSGYAIWCRKTSLVTIEGCVFHDNTSFCNLNCFAGSAAIGCYGDGAGVVVRNCTFVRNTGVGGGAIYTENTTIEIVSCVFAQNRARRESTSYKDLRGTFKSVTYCAFDGDVLPSQADKNTCRVGQVSFKDAENNDFTPIAGDNVAVGIGPEDATAGAIKTTADGCFFRCDVTAARAVPFTANFTAFSAAGSDFSWDFGDGGAGGDGQFGLADIHEGRFLHRHADERRQDLHEDDCGRADVD